MPSGMFIPLFLTPNPLELGLLFFIVLVIFGPGRLPEVFRAMGDGVRHFKDAANRPTPPPIVETTPAPSALPENKSDI